MGNGYRINYWKEKHPEFLQSVKRGKKIADAKVSNALYSRAVGFECDEDKVFCNSQGEVTTAKIKGVGNSYPPC